MKKQKQEKQEYKEIIRRDRARREEYRAYVREKFIEEYLKAQDMTQEEKAWRIANVDHLVDLFMEIADRTDMIPVEDGVLFVTDGDATFIRDDELDELSGL